MDVLNRAMQQFSELLRSMSPSARISSGLLLAAVVGGLAYFVHWQTTSTRTYLLGGHTFSIAEVHAVSAAFGQAGLKDFVVEGGQIKIPTDKLDIYLAAMADANVLPEDFGDYLIKTIQEQSPLLSPRLHDQAIMAARERVLSNAVSKLRGIDTAQVFLSVLDKASFRGERVMTASVDVKTLPDRPLDWRQVRAIRSLVAGGTAGLKREQVTVVDSSAGRDFPGTDDAEADSAEDAYLARQEAFERRFEDAILRSLSYVPGATASVHVQLAQRAAPGGAEPLTTSAPGTDSTSPKSPENASGANSRATLNVTPAAATEPKTIPLVADAELQVPTSSASLQQFVPDRVTAAITIPDRYFQQLLRKNSPHAVENSAPLDPAALAALREDVCKKIQKHVLAVIPHDPQADPNQLVSVTSFEQVASTNASPGQPLRQARPWLEQNWQTAGMILGAAFLMAMAWSKWRSPAKTSLSEQASSAERPIRLDAKSEPLLAGPHAMAGSAARRGEATAALREELAQSVRENPDAAADILRSWIGHGN